MTENERLYTLRKHLGLTMEKFAAPLGITKSAISNLESGRNSISNQLRIAICTAYNVNPEWMKDGTGEMLIPKTKEMEIGALVASAAALTTEEARAFFNDFLNSLDPAEMVLLASILKSHLKTKKED